MENTVQIRLPFAQPKYYSKRYWKSIGGKAYLLAGLDATGLLLTETSLLIRSQQSASLKRLRCLWMPPYSACGCHPCSFPAK
jgi:hypothetical protein